MAQQVSQVIDGIVSGSQSEIACSVWAIVRFSLRVASISDYYDQLSDLIMMISRDMPINQEMERIYPNSRALQAALCEYSILVIQLCCDIIKFLGKNTASQVVKSVIFPFDSSAFSEHKAKIRAQSKAIRRIMTCASQTDVRETAQLTVQLKREVEDLLRIQSRQAKEFKQRQLKIARTRLLDACSIYNYEISYKQARAKGM